MQTLIKETFTGIGQIFLQENGLTGLVITVAILAIGRSAWRVFSARWLAR